MRWSWKWKMPAVFCGAGLLCVAAGHARGGDPDFQVGPLGHYPPKLRTMPWRGGIMETDYLKARTSPAHILKAFLYRPVIPDATNLLGVVDARGHVLWQHTVGSDDSMDFWWSSDSRYLIFWTRSWGGELGATAPNGATHYENYVYVLSARTGRIVYQADPDSVILHLDRFADPIGMRQTLAGAGCMVNADVKNSILIISEHFGIPGFFREDPNDPIPGWYKRPVTESIKIRAVASRGSK